MTDLGEPTKLDLARAGLHAAAAAALQACGWPAERASPFPPADTPVPPAAWVEAPTMHQAPGAGVAAIAATFPVVFAVDGSVDAQQRLLDRLMAHAWARLSAVKIGTTPGHETAVTIQSAAPDDVDVTAGSVLAVRFSCTARLAVRSLCGDASPLP